MFVDRRNGVGAVCKRVELAYPSKTEMILFLHGRKITFKAGQILVIAELDSNWPAPGTYALFNHSRTTSTFSFIKYAA